MNAHRPRSALERRIASYVRYRELIAEQAEALRTDDLGRFEELGAERDALAESQDPPDETTAAAPEDLELERLTAAARRELQLCIDADLRLNATLRELRGQALGAIRELDARRPHVGRYLQTDSPGSGLDLRL